MKKWLVGCLVAGFILVVLVCGAAYLFIWRPLSAAAGGDVMGQVSDLKKIGEAEQAVKNKSAFNAPEDGKLSAAQVDAFVAIQQSIHDKMGPDLAVLEDKYKQMSAQESVPSDANLKDIMGAYADITSLMAKAKQAQVEALNMQGMSLEEYRWIRDQVNDALPYLSVEMPAPAPAETGQAGAADSAGNGDKTVEDAVAKAMETATDAVKESIPGSQQIEDAIQGPTSERARSNIELLRPHRDLIYKTMTSAWLGM